MLAGMGYINRVLSSLQAGQKNIRVIVPVRIELFRALTIGKILDLYFNSGCVLARSLANKIKN